MLHTGDFEDAVERVDVIDRDRLVGAPEQAEDGNLDVGAAFERFGRLPPLPTRAGSSNP